MSHLIVDNQLPRILSFRGKMLVIKPGENKVDPDLWHSLFFGGEKARKDPTMVWYYEQGSFDVTDADGNEWLPDGVKKAKRPSKALLGPNHRTATGSARKPRKRAKVNDTTKEPPKEPVAPVAPRQVGGGVPGNVDEAKSLIASTNDVEQLEKWLSRETRAMVVPVLMERLESVSE